MYGAIVTSFSEAAAAFEAGLQFPILAVPFGAECEGTPCQVFPDGGTFTEDAFDGLSRRAFPHQGRASVHLISKAGQTGWKSWRGGHEFSLVG